MNNQGMAISMVYPILKTIAQKGFDRERFYTFASFDAGLLNDVESRLADGELERLMKAAADYTGDDHFGLRQGQLTEVADMGILGYVMMHSATVSDALTAYQRYNVILCSGFTLEWEREGDEARLYLYADNPAIPLSRHCMEDMASSIYHLLNKMTTRRVVLHDLHFTHPAPQNIGPYLEVMGIAPVFEAEVTMLKISEEVLDYPVAYADAKLLRLFEKMADEAKARLTAGKTFTDQVSQWMMRRLPAAFPSLRETAQAFGLSTRSLQAKLKEEGASYQDLSVQLRREVARRLWGA